MKEFALGLGLRRPKEPDPYRAARDLLLQAKVLKRRHGSDRLWVVTVAGVRKMFPDDYPDVLAKLRGFDFDAHAHLLRRRGRRGQR